MIAKCSCQYCNGAIEFDANELVEENSIVPCPHCGLETKLFIPQTSTTPKPTASVNTPATQPQVDRAVESSTVVWSYVLCFLIPIAGFFFGVYLMAKKKSGHGAACMAISIVLGLGWLALFTTHNFTLFANQSIPKNFVTGETNLQAVQGAYGWNLGGVLPNNFEAKTNVFDGNDIGITCGFEPSGLPGSVSGWLDLTEDRRITAITISMFKANRDQLDVVEDTLRKKYGLRKVRHHSDKSYDSYFGTQNRQAVLQITGSPEGITWLFYRDEELCRIADTQTENRKVAAKAAAKKQIEDELKTRL